MRSWLSRTYVSLGVDVKEIGLEEVGRDGCRGIVLMVGGVG